MVKILRMLGVPSFFVLSRGFLQENGGVNGGVSFSTIRNCCLTRQLRVFYNGFLIRRSQVRVLPGVVVFEPVSVDDIGSFFVPNSADCKGLASPLFCDILHCSSTASEPIADSRCPSK